MKYIDGFRDSTAASSLRDRLNSLGVALTASGQFARIMEVCGTHTMAISRYGIRDILPENVELISGPGCPVCVTDAGYIDAAIALAERDIEIYTFGDLIHVPGSTTTLARCRAAGGRVEVCYSPSEAVARAQAAADREVVFLAIGFETTMAPVVGALDHAVQTGIKNFSLLTAFKCVPPVLSVVLNDPELKLNALLCPAHVSAIIGAEAYHPFTGKGGVPCVVAGFEPLDILYGLVGILEQIARGESRVDNQYSRVVRPEGNPRIRALIDRYLEPVSPLWRGLGVIPDSGMGLRSGYGFYDAEHRHGLKVGPGRDQPGCRCGEVVKGVLRPPHCPLFGKACTPDHAVGPCMVSSEGTCAAYFKYEGPTLKG